MGKLYVMKDLIDYLNSLTRDQQDSFAAKCKTSVGYLRKAASVGQNLGERLCVALERESGGAIRCESLRPDVDWAYLANRTPKEPANV